MRYSYEVIIDPADAGHTIHVPDFDEVWPGRDTLEATISHAADGLEAVIATHVEGDMALPKATFGNEAAEGSTRVVIVVDVTDEDIDDMSYQSATSAAVVLDITPARVRQLFNAGRLAGRRDSAGKIWIHAASVNERLANPVRPGGPKA